MPKNKNFGGAGFTPPTSEGGGNGIIPGRVKKVFLNVEDGGDFNGNAERSSEALLIAAYK